MKQDWKTKFGLTMIILVLVVIAFSALVAVTIVLHSLYKTIKEIILVLKMRKDTLSRNKVSDYFTSEQNVISYNNTIVSSPRVMDQLGVLNFRGIEENR